MIHPSDGDAKKEALVSTPFTREDILEKTPSAAFRIGSSDAIQQVLEEVEKAAEKRIRNGLSEVNFTLGVFNCFVITYVFAAFPQHLWLMYVVEAFFFFPIKFRFLYINKPLSQVFYFLDYCWIMNMAGVAALIALFAGKAALSEAFKKHVFLAAYGTSCGPLVGATATLPFISLIFHDVNSMTSVFIHFFPPLLFYILRWRGEEVLAAWPDTFHLNYEMTFFPNAETPFFDSVFGNTLIAYLLWYIPYCIWVFTIGFDLPRTTRRKKLKDGTPAPTKYDTVFHANHRNGNCVAIGKLFWGRSVEESKKQNATNDFELRDLIVYMIGHFMAAICSILFLAYPSYLSKHIHGVILVLLLVVCTWRGAKRYTYYSTEMYARIIRSKFGNELRGVHENDAFFGDDSKA